MIAPGKKFKPAPEDAGPIPGGIRDRAMNSPRCDGPDRRKDAASRRFWFDWYQQRGLTPPVSLLQQMREDRAMGFDQVANDLKVSELASNQTTENGHD